MLPKFSIALSFRTMTFCSAMRFAPFARLMLIIAGNSCGVSPTESANANIKESNSGFFIRTLKRKMAASITAVIRIRNAPNFRTPRSKSVGVSLLCTLFEIFPNSLSGAVCTTTALPEPVLIPVPM